MSTANSDITHHDRYPRRNSAASGLRIPQPRRPLSPNVHWVLLRGLRYIVAECTRQRVRWRLQRKYVHHARFSSCILWYVVRLGASAYSNLWAGLGAFAAPLVATQLAQSSHWSFHYLISAGIGITNVAVLAWVFKFKNQDGKSLRFF